MFHRPLYGALLMLLPLLAEASGFSRLAELTDQGFLVGAEARLLGGGERLGAIEPERQLSPASVSKVYVAAAALARFGPQHRFTSRLVSTVEPDAEGVLKGDLVFDGGGDPALTSEDLWRLVQRLYQAGVRRVDGRLVISQWRFGPVECLTTDRCEARERVDNAYSALLSSAGVNFGSWCVAVAPAATAGQSARIDSCDSQAPIVEIDNRVQTLPDDSGTELNAERIQRDGNDVMVLSGQVSTNARPRQIYRASSDPAWQTAHTLRAMLEQAGITLGDGVAVAATEPPASARQLAAVDGEPLQELLLRTLNYSNNFMADVLTLSLVETPRVSLSQGGAALEAFVAGIPDHGPVTLRSGSGLTPENRTSAAGVTALLEYMYHRPSLFPSFVAALQSPGNGVMRFHRRGSATFQHHVMLKTGTLNQPVSVRAVGGYFRTRSGQWGVFSALVNGTATTPWLGWRQVLDPLAADLEEMIDAH
ncbi:D-alanyl-D-alanine carboxypeptidase/D-alanyl-D-alanine endopeptidase [Halomonas saccharevitans]|uniref:D-alanyl-D-alanine carboxypeptidase / D-alanyl-D-alanine-endopeptidase (Penicillin-binding protein 4) n=1 Tax=Halomonas saccharevitans TaxID=416872 RepID=A0A1I7BXZ3_9GAMM|nr:D-alanyl-D-alanine carboxypeptidase/D-alanyl-D-alanine-endopeptidase [Halomonas saccharevitans]SFT92054.1 D-alanyl-D-alanine carboxypeptidase / D-alanyl-D-alanine-endopeptidase (penicillin-binding protein 4) [Halomonas saccharevitans]